MTPDTLLISLAAVFVGFCVGIGAGIAFYLAQRLAKHYEEKEMELS